MSDKNGSSEHPRYSLEEIGGRGRELYEQSIRLQVENDENIEGSLDDILVRTPGFQAMIEQSSASLEQEGPISAEELLAELRAKLAGEQKKGRQKE